MKQFLPPILLALLLAALLFRIPYALAERSQDYEWLDPVVEARRILVDNFVDPIDHEATQDAVISALVDSLDDPYTTYVPEEDEEAFTKAMRGTYAGIGAEVTIRDGYLAIVSPMRDSPALRAGIRAGDLVLSVEGISTEGKTVEDCVGLLSGPANTDVDARIRDLDGNEKDITITRAFIQTRTIRGLKRVGEGWEHCLDPDLGLHYVRVTQFNQDTVAELQSVLRPFGGEQKSLNGIILDLRDDPGGALPSAVAMADLFLSSGDIVRVEPRKGTPQQYSAESRGTLPADIPMIVMINGSSASASEIVAGALQDNGRAKVLGTRSFGKGSVQEVRPLRYGGGVLKFTIAHYILPSGRNLHRRPDATVWGVDPDYVVPISDADYFAMITKRREFEVISESDAERGPVAHSRDDCVPLSWVRDTIADEQLARAADILADRLGGAAWPEPTVKDAGQVALAQERRRVSAVRADLLERLQTVENELAKMEGTIDEGSEFDLIPDDAEVAGGTITVRAADGTVIGTFTVESGDVEAALQALELERADADASGE